VWWARSEPLEVYLSDREVGLGRRGVRSSQWAETSDLSDALQQLAGWFGTPACSGVRQVRVWLSGDLARPYLVPAASGARSAREARVLATAMAADAAAFDGEVRLWLDRWRSGEPTLAVAIPAQVWQGLHEVVATWSASRAGNAAIGIASIRPWWNMPFDELLADSRREASRLGWSLADAEGAVHGVIDKGAIVEIGYDRPGVHDPAGVLLRRRLQVNWGAISDIRHLRFERDAVGAEPSTHVVGACRDVAGNAT